MRKIWASIPVEQMTGDTRNNLVMFGCWLSSAVPTVCQDRFDRSQLDYYVNGVLALFSASLRLSRVATMTVCLTD